MGKPVAGDVVVLPFPQTNEALKKGMEEKSKEFVEKGAEVYANA